MLTQQDLEKVYINLNNSNKTKEINIPSLQGKNNPAKRPEVREKIRTKIILSHKRKQPKILCACGCGNQRPKHDKCGRERKYIKGHMKGENHPFYGKKHKQKSITQMKKSLKGKVPWNKGKIGVYSEEYRKKISIGNKGKKRSKKFKDNLKTICKERIKKGEFGFKKGHPYGNRFQKGIVPWSKENFKGKTYEQLFGKKKAEQRKRKMSKKMVGKKIHSEEFKIMMKAKMVKNNPFHNPETRRKAQETMQRLRNEGKIKIKWPFSNTSIELKLQQALKKENIIFTTQKKLLGRPDIFIEPNICIFADGDFWHANPSWMEKNKKKSLHPIQEKVRERDKKVNTWLKENDYIVLRFWEDNINKNIDNCLQQIQGVI